MRLANVLNPETRKPMAVVQRPGGWVALRDLADPRSHQNWDTLESALPDLKRVAAVVAAGSVPPRTFDTFLPPILRPATFRDFYAFEQHVATCRAKRGLPMEPAWYAQPAFYFSNPVALVGSDARVYPPAGCVDLDYELELAAIIGTAGRDISPQNAWKHIAGFTILNDLSARDLQRREMPVGLGPAKGKDFATALGPALLTLDELRDRIDSKDRVDLAMRARVNGRELSNGNAASMHFTWPQLIAHASRDADLLPGDLIGSGTVGTGCILELGPENTGGWLKPGDTVELEIERLGILRTAIVPRPGK